MRDLPLDLRDVAVWLQECNPGLFLALVVDRNGTELPEVLSHVVTFADDAGARRMLRAEAERVLLSMGYEIRPVGGDTYQVRPESLSDLSDQERLQVLARIRAGLDDVQFRDAFRASRGRVDGDVNLEIGDDF